MFLSPRFQIDGFADPANALAHFKADFYDLLILDIKMPQMNGFELYKVKKKDKRVKVFFSSDMHDIAQ